jgi:hypothetical protein
MATSARNFQQFFPFSSEFSTWEEWNGNFIIWYGQHNVEYQPEENWKLVAEQIMQSSTFSQYPVPDPDSYGTWQPWATELALIINGEKR